MDIIDFLKSAVEQNSSDIYIIAGRPLTYKLNGHITTVNDERLDPVKTEKMVKSIYFLAANRDINRLVLTGDDDFSFAIPGVARFRVSAYKQRGSLAAVIRVVQFSLPDPKDINIPDTVLSLANMTRGLILVTGPAGSGKSTTLACIIDIINSTRSNHIITLEDPLEYLHNHKQSVVSQREISSDTESYVKALRAALRQSPDVVLLGEMRDYDTINVAMTAAETGHLVISTLHTVGAANTIDRIIDVFPSNQQHQIRIQLSMVLQAVVSQQLLPTTDGIVPAFEIMLANGAVRNMIRESKIHQIDTVIQSSASEGMVSMDTSLLNLYKQGKISEADAIAYSTNSEMMAKRVKL
ncbi:PilT/PilU family type 4a pilus ATPase [Ruminococcaceae bacterium OttesenSCG-928-L11]|nr:PilT/PilU family type 4a pilus ATPase [Ruminococcaceae bacterium OttesenSCG-928-L11]